MLIETDVILAHIKKEDWLKPYAEYILRRVVRGELELYVSREVIHEVYYIVRRLNLEISNVLDKLVALTKVPNLIWVPTTVDLDLAALALLVEYGFSSIFDAYYAATALLYVPDRTIISTNDVYDRIPGLNRIDPREISSIL